MKRRIFELELYGREKATREILQSLAYLSGKYEGYFGARTVANRCVILKYGEAEKYDVAGQKLLHLNYHLVFDEHNVKDILNELSYIEKICISTPIVTEKNGMKQNLFYRRD